MEKMLFALEEKDLENVVGGFFKEVGTGIKELNKAIFLGDSTSDKGFFGKRKDGVAKAWDSMPNKGVKAAVVATEVAVPAAGVVTLGGVITGGVLAAKKLMKKN